MLFTGLKPYAVALRFGGNWAVINRFKLIEIGKCMAEYYSL